MKNLRHMFVYLGLALGCILTTPAFAQQWNQPDPGISHRPLRIGIVNTKRCLDESKLGKQELANFERMKNQMEATLQDKERNLEEIESKLNDEDYLDSISADVENELKRKRRQLRQEGYQLQNQFIQTLQQTQVKTGQRITESISQASAQLSKESYDGEPNFDIIFSDEACAYYGPYLDATDQVIARMNALFDKEQRDNQNRSR